MAMFAYFFDLYKYLEHIIELQKHKIEFLANSKLQLKSLRFEYFSCARRILIIREKTRV